MAEVDYEARRIRLTKPEARQVIHELMEWLQAGTK